MRTFFALLVQDDTTDRVRDDTAPATAGGRSPAVRVRTGANAFDGLDPAILDELLHHLQRARDASQDAALVAEIRDHLAARSDDLYHREPRWVLFHTSEWEDGHFLTDVGATVYLPEGDHVQIDFDRTRVGDLLTARYGARGRRAGLGVDLHTGQVTFDDYNTHLPDRLGIPINEHADGDGCASYPTDYTVERDGTEVSITDLSDGDTFLDYDGALWLAAGVSRVREDVHVDIQPVHAD